MRFSLGFLYIFYVQLYHWCQRFSDNNKMTQKQRSSNEHSKNNIRRLKVIAGAIKAAHGLFIRPGSAAGGLRAEGGCSVDGTAPGPPLANNGIPLDSTRRINLVWSARRAAAVASQVSHAACGSAPCAPLLCFRALIELSPERNAGRQPGLLDWRNGCITTQSQIFSPNSRGLKIN